MQKTKNQSACSSDASGPEKKNKNPLLISNNSFKRAAWVGFCDCSADNQANQWLAECVLVTLRIGFTSDNDTSHCWLWKLRDDVGAPLKSRRNTTEPHQVTHLLVVGKLGRFYHNYKSNPATSAQPWAARKHFLCCIILYIYFRRNDNFAVVPLCWDTCLCRLPLFLWGRGWQIGSSTLGEWLWSTDNGGQRKTDSEAEF